MHRHPVGIDTLHWANGITSGEANWGSVLTDGVAHGDDRTRRRMATALAEDRAGFEDLLRRVPRKHRDSFERLHALALDPDAVRTATSDPAVEADVQNVRQVNMTADCGPVF